MLAALLAIGAPIAVSLHLVDVQSEEAEFEQARLLASAVAQRTEEMGMQLITAVAQLKDRPPGDPCSTERINLMRRVALDARYLKFVGYSAANRLICSSLGDHGLGIPLGPVKYVTELDTSIRPAVRFPMLPGRTFFVSEQFGVVVVVDRDLSTDLSTVVPDVSLGVFGSNTGMPIAVRGAFRKAWTDRAGKESDTQFFDGDYVVALHRSSKFGFVGYAAVPATHLQKRAHEQAWVMLPLGFGVAVLLLFALSRLLRQQISLPVVMRGALARKEFFLEYQPIVALDGGRCVGVEALIRWKRPDGAIIRPDTFIPVAEENNLICRITEQVIEMVAEDGAALLRRHPEFRISLNVASLDLSTPRTVQLLADLVRRPGFSPENIVIEATERGLLRTNESRDILQEIRALGIRAAIDDFGTGYSGLSYLGTFVVDYLKIDKAFVDTIGTDAVTSNVAVHIIELAKTLGLAMIAEGVETQAQSDFLREHGVQFAQGWLFGKPVPMRDLIASLSR